MVWLGPCLGRARPQSHPQVLWNCGSRSPSMAARRRTTGVRQHLQHDCLEAVGPVIDAFADLRKRHDARLLIVGQGPGRARAAEQIRRLELDAHAEAVGWVDDQMQFAARAWAFVLASDEEGFAQVLTEAMSAGCPVVTTDALEAGRAS